MIPLYSIQAHLKQLRQEQMAMSCISIYHVVLHERSESTQLHAQFRDRNLAHLTRAISLQEYQYPAH